MKNKLKIGLMTALCVLAVSCGNSGQSGKVLYESGDKKIRYMNQKFKLN